METICALATPRMNCAIHIIRVSGDQAFEIVQKISQKTIKKTGFIIQRNLIFDQNELIDDVLLNTFVSPKSYTGEDLVEINCHGGVVVADRILGLLVKYGCKFAKKGEFTQRALLNKKIDLAQVEAINNLVNAQNNYSIKGAINALVGDLSEQILAFQQKLFLVLGQIEVNIDYPEFDDVPQISDEEVLNICLNLSQEMKLLLEKSRKFLPISHGIKVAIVGKPNVGKSSLLNFLSNQDKAIVSDIAGTTRDIVESQINLDGISLHLLDTAGIRETNNTIEKIGIAKSYDAVANADLIIYLKEFLDDENLSFDLKKGQHLIEVYTKKDLYNFDDTKPDKSKIWISIKDKFIDDLIIKIKEVFSVNEFDYSNLNVLQSQRQIDLLEGIKTKIDSVVEDVKLGTSLDLVVQDLEEANLNLNDLLGKGHNYDFLDELFKNFCVGK